MAHLKRYKAPKSWNIKTKGITFVSRPMPGTHALGESITLNLLIKKLNFAQTSREVKQILNDKKVLVNNIVRKEPRFPVGLMDIISIPELKKNFRILIDQNGNFVFNPIKEDNILPCKIKNKTIIKGKKIQLNMTNGFNLIVSKDTYSVGDTLLITLDKKEIKKHLKLEKGAHIYLIGGRHVGSLGIIEEIITNKDTQPSKIVFKTDKHKYQTLKKYAFVIEPNLVNINENDKSNAEHKN